nr:MAG TPA: helix-turn-helix domain protein [Bacteriophage sp.]
MCWICTFAKRKEMKTYIKEYLQKNGITQKELADRLGVTQSNVSATISRPSFPTLERIAAALDVEPWQLLAPPAVVDELKQARAQRAGGGGGGLVGVVRVGCEIYTADTVQQLRAIVERLERDAAGG